MQLLRTIVSNEANIISVIIAGSRTAFLRLVFFIKRDWIRILSASRRQSASRCGHEPDIGRLPGGSLAPGYPGSSPFAASSHLDEAVVLAQLQARQTIKPYQLLSNLPV
jgi:hypothetical protein